MDHETVKFYGDWIFYGGLAGSIGTGVTVAIWGKKIGFQNIRPKHYFYIIAFFTFPTIFLPILLIPDWSAGSKFIIVTSLSLFGVARFYATDGAQKSIKGFLNRKKDQHP